MEFREYKTELGWLLVGVAFFALIYMIFKGPTKKAPRTQASINYEMPRPQARLNPDFSLDGREVDYEYDNPFEKAQAKAKGKSVKADKGVVKNVKPDKKKNTAKKATAKKKTEEPKKEEANAAVTENGEGTQDPSGQSFVNNTNRPNNSNIQGRAPIENPEEDSEEDRSEQQWRSLLNAQPTRENMDKLVVALRKRQVSEGTFMTIVEDLLKNQKTETQKVGLYGARAVQSPRAFILLSDQYDTLSAENKPVARQIMLSYGQSPRVDALAQVLRSGNQKATLNALNVIQSLLQNSRPDPREVRAGAGQRNTRRYSTLLPTVQQLQQAGSPEVAQLAGQVYGQLVQIGVQPPGGFQQASATATGPGFVY